jgi:YVTN family beta-propeller protein
VDPRVWGARLCSLLSIGLVVLVVVACAGTVLNAAPAAVVSPGPVDLAPPGPATLGPDAAARVPPAFNVYASTISGQVAPQLAGIKPRVFVPNSNSNWVAVIDPATMTVVDRFSTGNIPHHVAPAPDLSTLYVDNEGSSSLTQIDIETGRPVRSIPVTFPYNLYFTLDGLRAVVVAERLRRIEFWDAHTWKQLKVVDIPWAGADHLDFTADGHYLFVSTEYTGMLARVNVDTMELEGAVRVGGLPVDVRLAPDGKVLYVANQGRHGVSIVDPVQMAEVGFIPTARGAHGLQVSRDTTQLYVSNRDAGTVSIIDFARRTVVGSWKVGGSPDMMQLSPDGKQLWLSSRYDGSVIVVDTGDGRVIKRIPVGPGAHGLTYFPNAGSISTGHNGVYR